MQKVVPSRKKFFFLFLFTSGQKKKKKNTTGGAPFNLNECTYIQGKKKKKKKGGDKIFLKTSTSLLLECHLEPRPPPGGWVHGGITYD